MLRQVPEFAQGHRPSRLWTWDMNRFLWLQSSASASMCGTAETTGGATGGVT